MRRIKCLKCGSVGYSASLDTSCECGGRCNEIIILDEIAQSVHAGSRHCIKAKNRAAGLLSNILRSLL